MIHPSTDTRHGYAAVFIDFENLYYHLRGQYVDHPDISDAIFELLRRLRAHLETQLGFLPIIQKAYADFERLKTAPQGSLYLMGIDTHNVLGTDHKNAADMRLCIDAMEVLYTRPEIETFVFVAGDRDYIPVVQHLRRQARSVLVAAFRGSSSGDLLLNVGEGNFIEAMDLIDPVMIRRLEFAAKRQAEIEDAIRERAEQESRILHASIQERIVQPNPVPQTPLQAQPAPASKPVKIPSAPAEINFGPTHAITEEAQRTCLRVMLENFGQFAEIYLSPFLRILSDTLPRLADYERKALLSDLETAGAIRIMKRKGEPFDYSVIVVNYNHTSVRELNPG